MIKHIELFRDSWRPQYAIRLAALIGAAWPVGAWAQAEVTVSTGAKAATNPLLRVGDRTGAVAATFELAPRLRMSDDVSTVQLRAAFRLEQYSRRYGGNDSTTIGLDVDRRLNERWSIRAGASFASAKSGGVDQLLELADPSAEPGAPPEPTPPDPGLPLPDATTAGQSARLSNVGARVLATYLLDPVSTLDARLSASYTRSRRPDAADYRYYTQQLGYGRRISERTSITAAIRIGEADYGGRRGGDAVLVTPLFGLEKQVSSTLAVSAKAGVSITHLAGISGGRSTTTALAGEAAACNRGFRDELCVTGSRVSQPTAGAGVTSVSALGVDYNRTLSLQDRFSLTFNYSRTKRTDFFTTSGQTAFLRMTARVTHNFNRALSSFASAGYADVFQPGINRKANMQLRLGLSYRFGAH